MGGHEVPGNQEQSEGNNSSFVEPDMVPVSYGTDTEGVAWTIRVGVATYGNAPQINWDWTSYRSLQNNGVTTPADTAQINTFVDNDRTYVLADLPRAVAASARAAAISRAGSTLSCSIPRHRSRRRPHLRRVRIQRTGCVHRANRWCRWCRARDVAGAVKDETAPEIIEIIDDDTDAFGDRARSHTSNDVGGPRWVGPVAAAALVGLIGYGVATSSPTTATRRPATVTSTTVATKATMPTPSTSIVPAPTLAYYAADPPRGFSVQYANLQPLDHAPFTGYGYELWATPDSSAIAGKWFSIVTYRGASTLAAADAYRVQAGRLSVAIAHNGGQSVTQFTADERLGVTITSFGWSDDDLVRLATSVLADERSIGFADAWFKADHDLISTVQPWLAVQSVPAEQVAYESPSDPGGNVVITVGRRLRPDEGGTTETRQIALRFLLDRGTPFTVDGHPAVAGAVVSQAGRALATWIADDHVFTVSATMAVSQLIGIARTVHEVSANEWDGMKFQAVNAQISTPRDDKSPVRQIWSDTGPGTRGSKISVATALSGGQKQILWSWGKNGMTTRPDDTPQVHTVVDNNRTYVLADLPRSIASAGVLQITGDGLDVTIPFVDIDPSSDRTFAGLRIRGTRAVHHRGPRIRRRSSRHLAITMRTDDSLETIDIIEIIDDDTDAFGDRSRTGTVHDTGGPKWAVRSLQQHWSASSATGWRPRTPARRRAHELPPAPALPAPASASPTTVAIPSTLPARLTPLVLRR